MGESNSVGDKFSTTLSCTGICRAHSRTRTTTSTRTRTIFVEDRICKRIDLATRARGSWFERELGILQAKAQELFVYSANRGALKRAAQS
jgi:hypothetical protein